MVDFLARKKPVGCKWDYTIKYKADGTLEKYKVRLVTKGYTQDIWYGLSRDIYFGFQDEHNQNFVIISNNYNWDLQ